MFSVILINFICLRLLYKIIIFTWSTTNIEITTLKSWNELTETEFSAYTNIILQIKNVHLSIHILCFFLCHIIIAYFMSNIVKSIS